MTALELVDRVHAAWQDLRLHDVEYYSSVARRYGYEIVILKPCRENFVVELRKIEPHSIHHDEL